MKEAQKCHDAILALTVLQQCTHKNVGGIINEVYFHLLIRA